MEELAPVKDPLSNVHPFDKGFAFIMRNLKPKSHQKSLKLMVPDTVFFQKGQPKFLVHNKRDREFNYVTKRHKLVSDSLKDFFNERKRKGEMDIQVYYPELVMAKRLKQIEM